MSFRITEETPYTDPHSRGTGSIVHERKGYILRTRGDHGHPVPHDYLCESHGVFEAKVPSGEVPHEIPCRHPSTVYMGCSKMATYQAPIVAQGWAAGTVKT